MEKSSRHGEREVRPSNESLESQEETITFDDDEAADFRPRGPSYSMHLGPTRTVKVVFAEEEEKEAYLVLSGGECFGAYTAVSCPHHSY